MVSPVCERCWLIFKLILSIVGTLSGISIFIIFLLVFHNYNAAVWGFISGIFSFCVFHLNYLYFKNKIEEWYDSESLENLKLLGLIVFLSSIVSFGVYLSLIITRHQDIFVMTEFSYFPAAIFSVLSFKSGLFLFLNARHYKNYVILCNPQFVYSIRRHPDSEPDLS